MTENGPDGLDGGVRAIVEGLDGARRVEPVQGAPAGGDGRDDPPPVTPQDDGPDPETCAVKPLGTYGGRYYYLTRLGQLAELGYSHHTTLGIGGRLFEGDVAWLEHHFPRYAGRGKNAEVVGFDDGKAAWWFMRRAAACGIVDVAADLRGLGAWADPDDPGRLVFHAGDAVLIGGKWCPPGRHGRHLYAAERRIDRPGDVALSKADAGDLLKLIGGWRYAGRDITPRLILGWLVAAGVPGALEWRPSIWFSGDKGTGKTTLLWLLYKLLGSAVRPGADGQGGVPGARPGRRGLNDR